MTTPAQPCGIEGCPNLRRLRPTTVATFCLDHDRALGRLASRLRRDTGNADGATARFLAGERA